MNVICEACRGQGHLLQHVLMAPCNRWTTEPCAACNSTGRVQCMRCHGKRERKCDMYHVHPCDECSDGTMPCSDCAGEGVKHFATPPPALPGVVCRQCRQIAVQCRECNGRGVVVAGGAR